MNRITSLVLAAGCACFVSAQKPDPFDLEVSNVLILQVRSIQKEVGMTEAQRSKLNVYATSFNASKDAFLKSEKARSEKEGKNFKPNETKLRQMFASFRGQVLTQLSAKQIKRLSELTLQEVGMAAMLDANVARKLALSPSQSAKLEAAYQEGIKKSAAVEQQAVAPIRKDFQGKDPNDKKTRDQFNQRMSSAEKESRPKLEKIKEETRAKFRAILSAQQQAQWKALQGTPFKG